MDKLLAIERANGWTFLSAERFEELLQREAENADLRLQVETLRQERKDFRLWLYQRTEQFRVDGWFAQATEAIAILAAWDARVYQAREAEETSR